MIEGPGVTINDGNLQAAIEEAEGDGEAQHLELL